MKNIFSSNTKDILWSCLRKENPWATVTAARDTAAAIRDGKNIFRITSVVLFFFCTDISVKAQVSHEQQILNSLVTKFHLVNDYAADVVIRTDVFFIHMFPVKGKLFYVKPDKFKVKTEGISILPKQNQNILFSTISDPSKYTALPTTPLALNGKNLTGIKVIPESDTGELVMARLFIEESTLLIYRAVLNTRSNGTITIDFTYGKYAPWLLPDSATFTVETGTFKMPKMLVMDADAVPTQVNPPKSGTISISYSTYLINQGEGQKGIGK